MRLTAVLLRKATVTRSSWNVKSLALSVHFKHPDFNMKEPEILSRASAFLLAVDPPEAYDDGSGGGEDDDDGNPFSHLEKNEKKRKMKIQKEQHIGTPINGPADRELKDIGWLEFAPREARPTVHCVCSSHVVAPFLWKDYYPHEWLTKIKLEHCTYSLEVYDPENPRDTLGRFALNPYPIHHPEGRDIALLHLKQEEENLKIMRDLGVQIHFLRDEKNLFKKGEDMVFDGYVVAEPNKVDDSQLEKSDSSSQDVVEDTRIFFPYRETGQLEFHSNDRFFARTPTPLPEGVCGGPVLDTDDKICGIVEGIVSNKNKNKDIAGCAAFMPNFVIAPFIEFAERMMLKKVLPKTLFDWSVSAKTTNSLSGVSQGPGSSTSVEETFDRAIDEIRKNYTSEEIDAIMKTIKREREEVMQILRTEGGDLNEIAARVRQRTLNVRDAIHSEFKKGKLKVDDLDSVDGGDNTIDAEIVDKK